MIETNTNLKEHINFFNDNKFVVFPCENKRPKVKFKDIQEQTVDELYQLFNDNDELAIRTGNGIIVVDIDTKGEDGKEGFRSITPQTIIMMSTNIIKTIKGAKKYCIF